MNRFFCFTAVIVTAVLLVSCSILKINRSANEQGIVPDLPASIEFSKGFRLFWNDLQLETQGLTSLEDYQPSKQMQRDNNIIVLSDGVFGIQGFMQVLPPLFDALTFEQLGGVLTYFSEGVYTFSMPVKSLPALLEVKGIIQIEMSQKIFLKRS
ncbi:MAG: hypothetical protein LBS16_05975 [Prevotellaceae bacterium]|jgi:hypothetical protein|nr:hypothetical protein [Prevotellaceae bacterium]